MTINIKGDTLKDVKYEGISFGRTGKPGYLVNLVIEGPITLNTPDGTFQVHMKPSLVWVPLDQDKPVTKIDH